MTEMMVVKEHTGAVFKGNGKKKKQWILSELRAFKMDVYKIYDKMNVMLRNMENNGDKEDIRYLLLKLKYSGWIINKRKDRYTLKLRVDNETINFNILVVEE